MNFESLKFNKKSLHDEVLMLRILKVKSVILYKFEIILISRQKNGSFALSKS